MIHACEAETRDVVENLLRISWTEDELPSHPGDSAIFSLEIGVFDCALVDALRNLRGNQVPMIRWPFLV